MRAQAGVMPSWEAMMMFMEKKPGFLKPHALLSRPVRKRHGRKLRARAGLLRIHNEIWRSGKHR